MPRSADARRHAVSNASRASVKVMAIEQCLVLGQEAGALDHDRARPLAGRRIEEGFADDGQAAAHRLCEARGNFERNLKGRAVAVIER